MYAVARGRVKGVFLTWTECQQSIKGYSGAKYKKFESREDAERFIEEPDYFLEVQEFFSKL